MKQISVVPGIFITVKFVGMVIPEVLRILVVIHIVLRCFAGLPFILFNRRYS